MKGLLQSDSALIRFGLISPVLNQICGDFCQINGIEKDTKLAHYQLTGSTNERITKNTSKLIVTLENQDVTFESDSQEIYNVVTKSVLPEPANNEIAPTSKLVKSYTQSLLRREYVVKYQFGLR